MAIKRIITAQEIPEVDTSPDLRTSDREIDAVQPDGIGWKLENSFRGEYNIFHVWKQGDINYDSGFENYWSSKSDDVANNVVGDGNKFSLSLTSSDSELSVEGEFIPYESYIYGGSIFWDGDSSNKTVTLEVIAKQTTLVSGDSITVDGNNKIVPNETQSGTHDIDVPTLVDNKTSTGWWDYTDHQLVPNYSQEGTFDLYNVDKTVARLLNEIDLMPSEAGNNEIKSENAWRVFPGYKFKFIAKNPDSGTWKTTLVFHHCFTYVIR